MVRALTEKSDLEKVLAEAGDKLVVIDFFATWCGPCKIIAPQIEELERQLPNVVFLKIDVDEAEAIATEYGISAMPTFVFIKNKANVHQFAGANIEKLKSTITANS